MRKICSSSSLYALANPSWQMGGGDNLHQLGHAVNATGTSISHYNDVQPKQYKLPECAADESVLWILQRHLQFMPISYAEAGFSVQEMLHHIRIFKEMQNGRKLGLLITTSKSKLPSFIKDAASRSSMTDHRKLTADINVVQVKRSQPAKAISAQSIEIHFADCRVHSHSTALEALGLQQLVAGEHVKVKKVQNFEQTREGLCVLAIARIKLSDPMKAVKGSWIKALVQQSCSCSFQSFKLMSVMTQPAASSIRSSSWWRQPVKIHNAPPPSAARDRLPCEHINILDCARAAVACITRERDWTTGYAGGGFVNELLKKWWVNGDDLRLSRRIGEGSSGAVFEATYRGHLKVAVKLVSNTHDSHFRRELLSLGSLQHPHPHPHHKYNILPLVGACRDSLLGRSVIVTRFMEGGSLHAYLQRQPRLDTRRVLQLATDMAKGMQFLHSCGIIHMDLKSPNIFVDRDGAAVIGDLGCARAENERTSTCKVDTGTYRWMAPEAFAAEEEGSMVAARRTMDVYSYGMVVWELVSGEVPWHEKNPVQAAATVVLEPALRPPIPAHCFPPLACLIRRCWDPSPALRPSFPQILRMLRIMTPNRHS